MNYRVYSACCCTSYDGKKKRLYRSKREAERVAGHIHVSRGVRLRVYECPDTHGWHLTKDLHGGW